MPPFTQTFPFPFWLGGSVSAVVGSQYPVSLNGRNYMLDTNIDFYSHRWRHTSISLLRPQADQSAAPSEASLNPDVLWRRAQDSFHGGAGQTFRDRDGGDPTRFRASKGVDPWTFWQLTLLNDTTRIAATSETNLYMTVAGTRLYVTDGQDVNYTTDLGSFSTVTSTPAETVTGIASNGFDVWIAYTGGTGIYSTDNGSSSASSYVTDAVDKVAFVKGRLMASAGPSIYNIVAGGALPTPLMTQSNSDWSWVGFAEGQAAIYAAGFSGDKSIIYRIAIKPDASSLDAPIIAGELPDGELIRSIGGYLGFIVLGTDLGVRFCQVDQQGNLNIGAAFGPGGSLAFEGQDTFIWFGWTDYDTTSTGTGRMDLRTFPTNTVTGARTPAYASDLMASGIAGNVTSIATFLDGRVFAVAGDGFYKEDFTSLVSEGTFETGEVGFGIPDEKILLTVDIRTEALVGSYAAALNIDAAGYTTIGSASTAGTTVSQFPITDGTGQHFELKITLSRDAMTLTDGPTLTRWTFKASPGGTDTPAEYLYWPILLYPIVRLPSGTEVSFDIAFERDTLKQLRRTRQVVSAQEAQSTFQVQMEDYEWIAENFNYDAQGFTTAPSGVFLAQLKVVS